MRHAGKNYKLHKLEFSTLSILENQGDKAMQNILILNENDEGPLQHIYH